MPYKCNTCEKRVPECLCFEEGRIPKEVWLVRVAFCPEAFENPEFETRVNQLLNDVIREQR